MQGRVLVVDDEKAMVLALKGLLSKEGYHVETAGSGEEALRRIETGSFHVVITDLSMNGVGGMQVLEHARRVDPDLAVVMITAYGSEKIAVQAMKLGAVDYVPKPFDNDELRLVVRRVMDTVLLRRDHRRLLEQVQGAFGFEQIVGQSPAMRRPLPRGPLLSPARRRARHPAARRAARGHPPPDRPLPERGRRALRPRSEAADRRGAARLRRARVAGQCARAALRRRAGAAARARPGDHGGGPLCPPRPPGSGGRRPAPPDLP